MAGIAGLLLHSLVDFNLHIPSNAILFLLLCALATSPPLPSELQNTRRRLALTQSRSNHRAAKVLPTRLRQLKFVLSRTRSAVRLYARFKACLG